MGNLTGNVLGNLTGDVTGNVLGNLTGTVLTNSQPNITAVGTLASLSVTGNIDAGNVTADIVTANDVSTANVFATTVSATGNVTANNISGSLITASQPNITAVGTLTSLSVVGNIAGNFFIGNGSQLTGLHEGYGNANVVTLLSAFGSNSISTTGNITSGNLTGTIVTSSQPNITAVGTLDSLSVVGNVTANYFVGNGSQLTGINSFSTIAVSGQSSVIAESIADTLTLAAGSGIEIVTNAGTDTITINSVGGDSIFASGGDMGTVEQAVTAEEDLGLITDAITQSYDLGTVVIGGLVWPTQLVLPSFTVAEIANLSAVPGGQMVLCTNEAGGTVPAFSDGTDWRRVTDRAVIT